MKRLLILLVAAWVCLPLASRAGILLAGEWTVDLTNPAEAKAKAEWSKPEILGITSGGLGREGTANSSQDGWIQTQPFAVGTSWRAPMAVGLAVEVTPVPAAFTNGAGQASSHWPGTAYARYSPDGSHWSTWQVLARDPSQTGVRAFKGELQVPYRERETYADLLFKYSALDVPWGSDEEAAVKWILKQRPDFFARTLPFIGYVQVLFEAPFGGGDRLKSLKVRWSCGMSGMAMVPNDPAAQKDHEGPWRFKAP